MREINAGRPKTAEHRSNITKGMTGRKRGKYKPMTPKAEHQEPGSKLYFDPQYGWRVIPAAEVKADADRAAQQIAAARREVEAKLQAEEQRVLKEKQREAVARLAIAVPYEERGVAATPESGPVRRAVITDKALYPNRIDHMTGLPIT